MITMVRPDLLSLQAVHRIDSYPVQICTIQIVLPIRPSVSKYDHHVHMIA